MHIPRLREVEKVMQDFKKLIEMENQAHIHNYYGLQKNTVKLKGFVQSADDFLAKIEEAKKFGDLELIETLKKADSLGLVQFQKFEPAQNSSIIKGRYYTDSKLYNNFREIIYQ